MRVLKRLSISEKELLTKCCIEDKTQQEIAAEMVSPRELSVSNFNNSKIISGNFEKWF